MHLFGLQPMSLISLDLKSRLRKSPNVTNLRAVCFLSAFEGTATNIVPCGNAARVESMVSVFPVPVGIMTVAG